MTNALRDNNQVPTMTGVLNTDGITITPVKASPTAQSLDISDGTSGSDFGPDNASRDDNGIPIMMAASNADGITPVPIYVNSDGKLMIKST